MSTAALLDASRRWASRLPTVTILMGSDESDGPADDTQCLLEAWRELGLCVDLVPWQQAAPPLGLVIPLGAWDYAEHRDAFAAKVRSLRAAGSQPAAALEAVAWHSHKAAYLLELAERGVPTVPTQLLRRISGDAAAAGEAFAAALAALGSPRLCVAKPAVGSRGVHS